MWKQLLFFGIIGGAFIVQDSLTAALPSSSVGQTDPGEAGIERKIDEAIQRAEKEVQRTQAGATAKNVMPTWNSKLELQNAITQLEVKKTLANNFRGTESLKSPLVREKLIQILNMPFITTANLADLQSLVLQEKARIRAEQNASPQTPK